ncbi:hypothetical protein ILYODFUR_004160 [Ilyodon furcidens]|uniref:Uncharacterized protein n=1 Tax=Ilyodon furcidens TaxID=33524 RepID=A0ABV0UPA1_9TELE
MNTQSDHTLKAIPRSRTLALVLRTEISRLLPNVWPLLEQLSGLGPVVYNTERTLIISGVLHYNIPPVIGAWRCLSCTRRCALPVSWLTESYYTFPLFRRKINVAVRKCF